MKECSTCEKLKPLEDYYKQAGTKDGHRGTCKDCQYTKKSKDRTPEEALIHKIYQEYKNSASFRGLEFLLAEEDFKIIISKNCYHCTAKPKLYNVGARKFFEGIYKNGVDRLDNTKGYVLANCVPCCSTCNYSRQDLSVMEWAQHCAKVAKHHGTLK